MLADAESEAPRDRRVVKAVASILLVFVLATFLLQITQAFTLLSGH